MSLMRIVCLCLAAFIFAADPCGAKERAHQKDRAEEKAMTETDTLTEEEGKQLLRVARETIQHALFGGKSENATETASSQKFSERRGTFVTLTINRGLRGCIGHIIPQETLLEGVRVNALNAAFRDPRFRPLSKSEFDHIKIEVSILTEPKPLAYSNAADLMQKLRPGTDGLIIKKGYHQATFLPQVWEQLQDKKAFLTHLCMKAGLAGNAWEHEKLEVLTYQVQAFHEE
jgi:AmmeMemoRadiSam system protein A